LIGSLKTVWNSSNSSSSSSSSSANSLFPRPLSLSSVSPQASYEHVPLDVLSEFSKIWVLKRLWEI
jgi:hypothetical protein